VRAPILFAPHTYLEGDPVLPKLFLAPAKGGAPLDDGRVGGAVAPSASSPSKLAGGRRMGRRQSGAERGLATFSNALWRHCVVVLCNLLMDYN
jgi:hypothetical protein